MDNLDRGDADVAHKSYDDRMAAILIADHERFMARLAAEADATIADTYHVSRGITGEPSEKNRTYRATDDCWNRGLRTTTVGTATDDGEQTVKVTKGEHVAIVPVSHFRKERIASKSRTHNLSATAERNLAARERLQDTLNAHAIGNVE
jgi:hypothetical protein